MAQYVEYELSQQSYNIVISGGTTFSSPEMVNLNSYSGNLINYVNNNDPVATANLGGGTTQSTGYVGKEIKIGSSQVINPIAINETSVDAS